jgi:phospholipid transport system substrate-binding protein
MVLAMANRQSIACLLALLVPLSFVTDATATFPTEALRGFFAQANRIVLSPDPDLSVETRRHLIRTLAHEVFDFREAASVALGPEWQARTPAEREEFARLFADLLEGGYIAMMGSKVTMHGGLIMDYVDETIEGDTAVVRTIVLTRDGNDLPVTYQMVRVDTRWLVRDVNIGGVSLVANYRAQFQRVMRASSYGELMARMRTRAPDAPPVAVATIGRPPAEVWHVAAPSIVDAPARLAPPVDTVQWVAAVVEPAAAVAPTVVPAAAPIIVPVPAIAQAPPTSGAFWVQVGAFRDDDAVIDVMERLRQHSVTLFNAAESTATGTREPVARVLVGPFSQWTDADAKLRELQASGFRPIIAEVRE